MYAVYFEQVDRTLKGYTVCQTLEEAQKLYAGARDAVKDWSPAFQKQVEGSQLRLVAILQTETVQIPVPQLPKVETMELTQKQMKELVEDEKQWGEKYANDRRVYLKAKLYQQKYLNQEQIHHATPFRCYREGKERFTRKDGQPLTREDITAIQYGTYGQGIITNGKEGDLEAVYSWAVDSSD